MTFVPARLAVRLVPVVNPISWRERYGLGQVRERVEPVIKLTLTEFRKLPLK